MTRTDSCLNPEQLTRAAFDVGASRLLGHAGKCPHCAASLRALSELRSVAQQLPDGAPTEEAADAVLAQILAADLKEAPPRRRPASKAVLHALVAASLFLSIGIAFALFHTHQDAAHLHQDWSKIVRNRKAHRATVHPNPGAKFSIAAGQPDEIVRLTGGAITVHVDKLHAGERFRVVTGNAEIEVRGTTFDVRADHDQLTSVRVISGEVAVRPHRQPEVLLHPGERWPSVESALPPLPEAEAPSVAEAEQDEVIRRLHPHKSDVPSDDAQSPQTEASKARKAAEAAFNEGWSAYNVGNYRQAAHRFDDAFAADPRSGFAEDAMFWKAVALDHVHNERRAAQALSFFIATYPESRRIPEASAMLGWKALDSGDTKQARALFIRAQKSPSERVRNSAAQGLERLDQP